MASKPCAICQKPIDGIDKRKTCSMLCRRALADANSVARFWLNVWKTETCWLWTGRLDDDGYGIFKAFGRNTLAHRFSWVHIAGKSANNNVLHECDVRKCVNPAHLFLGTQKDNVDDKVAKGRQSRGDGIWTAKLDAAKVANIRALGRSGWNRRELAETFGITLRTVYRILAGRTWKHLPAERAANVEP